MKKFFIIITCLWISLLNPLISSNKVPTGMNFGFDYSQINPYYVPITEEDMNNSLNEPHEALLAGFYLKTEIDPLNDGEIKHWGNGETSWIIKICSPGAPALAIFINQLNLSPNSRISVYPEINPKQVYTINENEINSDIISFPVMSGETLIVEYTEKNESIDGFFVICDIMVIYKGLNFIYNTKDAGTSKSCNVNINCSPEGDNWQIQKRSVAKMIMRMGTKAYLCTGSLVNNTIIDGTLYFLTAYHCAGNASESDKKLWQFYFDYEQPGCNNTIEPKFVLTTGCTQLAKGDVKGGSDFQLLQLNSLPNSEWKPYFNGWDNSEDASLSGVCIHHPDGDAKKISTYRTKNITITPFIDNDKMAEGSAWQTFWATTENGFGITEGGSSGSPLYNSNGLLIGTLTGGISDCYNSNSFDVFGKFNFHWDKNGATANSQLAKWLDPKNSGVTKLEGYASDIEYFKDLYEITFLITNNWDMPIPNIKIKIWQNESETEIEPKSTNSEGKATFLLPILKILTTETIQDIKKVEINYELTHNIHFSKTGEFTITGDTILPRISLEEDLRYIVLFPNPFFNQVNIANAKEVKRIKIYNFMGELIKEYEINDDISIETNFLKRGIYLFVTEDLKGKQRSFRLLKH
ncbi:MAG: T9SS type A sorting domain-containing protein [Marinilabiliaceae bacterium]|nr:T9SS type A sorting domain-containing protein [Marinilabiliaceae bacterium]